MKMENVAFGRKVRVTIYTPENIENNAVVFESNLVKGKYGLKISGTINKYFAIQPPDATIDIYNLSNVQAANIMNMKYKKVGNDYVEQQLRVKVEAGYEFGYFGEIFDGQILKPTMIKPDPNNTQLRLTCLNGANFVQAGGSLTSTFNDGVNYYSVARQIKENSNVDFKLELSETLRNRTVDGSFVAGATLYDTYQDIANENNLLFGFDNDTVQLRDWTDALNNQTEAFELNSETGLMGIPSLTTDGVTVQSVLNPNYKVLTRIKLNNADISINQPDYLASRQIGAWLSSDGLYIIKQVTHQFDTTTGAFCTNLSCVANNYFEYITRYNRSVL